MTIDLSAQPSPQELRLALILDALEEAVAVLTDAGMIVHANEALCRLVGWRGAPPRRRLFADLWAEPTRGELARLSRHVVGQSDWAHRVPMPGAAAEHGRELHLRLKRLRVPDASVPLLVVTLRPTDAGDAGFGGLEERMSRLAAEYRAATLDAARMLTDACEARDIETGRHIRRICLLTQAVARELGLAPGDASRMGFAATLHDVGKMAIPDAILKKPGPLTPDERREIERHTVIGERILGQLEFFTLARIIARHHHEAWNGTGYPDRLEGDAIPLAARIVAVVDTYDALVEERSYKPAWPADKAMGELRRLASVLYDASVIAAFEGLWRDGVIERIYRDVRENAAMSAAGDPAQAARWFPFDEPAG